MKTTILIFVLISFNAAAEDCQTLYQKQLKTDLSLSYKAFDQTMDQGFRSLMKKGLDCHTEAALLIEAYIDKNDAKQRSLRWHAAQAWAHAGGYDKAIKWSHTVIEEQENFVQNELRWNDFVLANLAFFNRDKASLIKHRNIVADAKDKHFGNDLNTKFLDMLINKFDQSYHEALSE